MPVAGLTLYASWITNTYTLDFINHDRTIIKTEVVIHGNGALHLLFQADKIICLKVGIKYLMLLHQI